MHPLTAYRTIPLGDPAGLILPPQVSTDLKNDADVDVDTAANLTTNTNVNRSLILILILLITDINTKGDTHFDIENLLRALSRYLELLSSRR